VISYGRGTPVDSQSAYSLLVTGEVSRVGLAGELRGGPARPLAQRLGQCVYALCVHLEE